MDLLNDILKTQKLAREDKIKTFQTMFSEEPVAVKQANIKAQQVQELEDLKVKQEKELESLKDKHERSNEKLGLEKEKEAENDAIQKKRDADRKANESVELEEGKKIQDIARKHKRELQKIIKTGNLELSKKAEDELYQWASNSGEIHGDEEDEFWDWIDQNVDDLVKGRIKEDVELEESKVTCPQCKGKGCDHCDDTGYHIKEGKLVTGFADIIKLITKKVADRLEKEYSSNPEKGLGMINTIGAMVGHKVTDKAQSKGKLFLKFGEELEERYSDVIRKRTQSQQKAHQKAMMKSAKKSIKDYDAKNKNKNEESEVEEDRDYKKEYESYHKDPEQIKRRAKRNEARRSLKNSKKLTADKDVHHKDNNPMNNDKSNLSIVTQNYNRKEPRMRDKLKEKGCLPNAKRK